jgi:phenylacetic acid degradation operon negative regulatory protein
MVAMTTTERDDRPESTHRSRTVLVTFLGSIVRRMGNWMPIAGTIDLMAQLGLDAPSVRTAVFRLKKRGWLDSETRAGVRGYALTSEALTVLAAGDEVIWHLRQPANLEDGWCVVNFSMPESARAKRHQLRAHLSALGFGNVSTAMWIAPARMQVAAARAINELGLTSYCAVFVGEYVAGQDLTALLHRSWDLQAIDARYRAFIDRFREQARSLEASDVIEPLEAFVAYVGLVDHWRELPFRDPGLPEELLPDGWLARDAGALFERLAALLEGRALGHAASHWPGIRQPSPVDVPTLENPSGPRESS